MYATMPVEVRTAARKQFQLWLRDQSHPSLQFKKVGRFWSARVTEATRVLAYPKNGDYYWFWIEPHREYEKILQGK